MKKHLHFYTTGGRCTASMPIGSRNVHPSIEATLTSCLQFQLLGCGYRLVRWCDEEQAGTVVSNGVEMIVRVKPEGLMRDMKPIGATQMLATIRRDGVDVQVVTGLAA